MVSQLQVLRILLLQHLDFLTTKDAGNEPQPLRLYNKNTSTPPLSTQAYHARNLVGCLFTLLTKDDDNRGIEQHSMDSFTLYSCLSSPSSPYEEHSAVNVNHQLAEDVDIINYVNERR